MLKPAVQKGRNLLTLLSVNLVGIFLSEKTMFGWNVENQAISHGPILALTNGII